MLGKKVKPQRGKRWALRAKGKGEGWRPVESGEWIVERRGINHREGKRKEELDPRRTRRGTKKIIVILIEKNMDEQDEQDGQDEAPILIGIRQRRCTPEPSVVQRTLGYRSPNHRTPTGFHKKRRGRQLGIGSTKYTKELTERGFSNPLLFGNGGQECPPSFFKNPVHPVHPCFIWKMALWLGNDHGHDQDKPLSTLHWAPALLFPLSSLPFPSLRLFASFARVKTDKHETLSL